MSRIDRIRPTFQPRSVVGTARERTEAAAAGTVNLPVPVSPVATVRTFREERRGADSEFAAQLIGQDGERRGIRAGPAFLEDARAAYNRVEWSGRYDRRARAGRQTNTDI